MRKAEEIARELRVGADELERQAAQYRKAADILDPSKVKGKAKPKRGLQAAEVYRAGGFAESKRPPVATEMPVKEAAPYGYKKDGTPRKTRPPAPEATARARAARLKKQRAEKETRIRMLSSTHPTEAELKDRRVAHVTAEPA